MIHVLLILCSCFSLFAGEVAGPSHASAPVIQNRDVTLLPQMHGRFLQLEREHPLFGQLVVTSQAWILNYYFENRATPGVVFLEGQVRRYVPADRSVFRMKKHTPDLIRRAFETATFPLDPDVLTKPQRQILYAAGGAHVALALGFVREVRPTQPRFTNVKATLLAFKRLANFFISIRSGKDIDVSSVLMNDFILDKREADAMRAINVFASSEAPADRLPLTLIFGHEHQFSAAPAFGLNMTRAPFETQRLYDEVMLQAQAEARRNMEECLRRMKISEAEEPKKTECSNDRRPPALKSSSPERSGLLSPRLIHLRPGGSHACLSLSWRI